MKKTLRKILSGFLAALILLSAAPLTGLMNFAKTTAYAYTTLSQTIDGIEYSYHTSDDGKSVIITGMKNKTDKTEKINLVIPSKIDNLPVTDLTATITDSDSYGILFSNVRSITFPETLKNIGAEQQYSAYKVSRLNNLEEVNFNAVNCTINGGKKESHSFLRDCPKLSKINIGSKVEKIPDYFLANDGRLAGGDISYITSIEIPDNVKEIGKYAFRNCARLQTVKIGKGVSKIGDQAFKDCPALESITVDEDNNYFCSDKHGVLYNEAMTELYKYPAALALGTYYIATTTERIDSYAFSGNKSLVFIKIPDKVTNVYSYAFSECSALQTVQCGDALTNIDNYVFYRCENLSKVYFCKNIQSYGNAIQQASTSRYITDLYTENSQSVWINKFGEKLYDNIYANNYHFNWIPTYYILYDANGGTNAPDPTIKTKDVAINLTSKTPELKHNVTLWYLNGDSAEEKEISDKFSSWNTRPDGNGKKYAIGGIYKDNGDITLYAQWEFADISDCIDAPERSGYKFAGWYTEETGGEKITSTAQITDGMDLYAHWTKIVTYQINYNANGGTVNRSSDTVESGSAITFPTPSRSGYMCLGWSTTSTATSASYTCGSTYYPTANKTFYAVWKETYTVTYNANGGTVSASSASVESGKTVKLPTPTKSGYACLGWSTSSSASSASYSCGENYKPLENVTLYAVWIKKSIVRSVSVNPTNITVNYKDSFTVYADVSADYDADYTSGWSSSNGSVVSINNSGNAYAAKKGSATLTCKVTDEWGNTVTDTCYVTVKYSFWQWIIVILLFGWIWY